MATIKDIANKLGISVSAVSKSMNGASDISEELRQLVLDTAVELGYSIKRSRQKEHRKLALFIENMEYETENDFGYDIVLGFKQGAFKDNWDVDVIPVTPTFQLENKYDTYLLSKGYSGAFIVGFALQDEWMNQFKTTTMPTVLFDNSIKHNPNTCYVGTDNYEGIDEAIEHLSKLGHTKIAFLNGSLHSMVSEQRQEAFLQGMKNHNLKVDEKLLAYGYYVADDHGGVLRTVHIKRYQVDAREQERGDEHRQSRKELRHNDPEKAYRASQEKHLGAQTLLVREKLHRKQRYKYREREHYQSVVRGDVGVFALRKRRQNEYDA